MHGRLGGKFVLTFIQQTNHSFNSFYFQVDINQVLLILNQTVYEVITVNYFCLSRMLFSTKQLVKLLLESKALYKSYFRLHRVTE